MTIEEAKELKPGEKIKYPHEDQILEVIEVDREGLYLRSERARSDYSSRLISLDEWDYIVANKGEKVCS